MYEACPFQSRNNLNSIAYAQTQEVVTALTACTILYTDFSPGAVYFTIGAVAVSRVAKLLKHIFRKPRPEGSTEKMTYGYENMSSIQCLQR